MIRLQKAVIIKWPTPDSLGRWEIDDVLTDAEAVEQAKRALIDGAPLQFRFTVKDRIGTYEGQTYVTHLMPVYDPEKPDRCKIRAKGTSAPRLL